MSARDDALARDLAARARLPADPIHQIRERRRDVHESPHRRSFDDSPTAHELEALRYLSRGLTIGMTAAALGVSAEAVKDRLRRARLRLRAKNTTHAVSEAIRRGLIP